MTVFIAMSQSADFYPGLKDGEEVDDYSGKTIEWTFSLPRGSAIGPGIYRIEFLRTLAEEEALGSPLLRLKKPV